MAASEGVGGDLEATTVHEILSNERRYHLLSSLEAEVSADVGDLAEQIAAEEADVAEASSSQRQSVYVALIQNHLPKLDTMGVVEYDDDAKTVEPGPTYDTVEAYVGRSDEAADDDESRDILYPVSYWGIAIVGLTGHLWAFPIHVLATVMLLSLALIVIISLSIVEGLQYASGDLRPDADVEWAKWAPR